MKSLIKKILKEGTDDRTSFMGMRFDRLKSLQPTNYLVKSLKDKEQALKTKEMGVWATQMVDEVINEYDTVYENIKELLTYLDYNDISFKKVMQPKMPVFYVKLPKYINDEFKKLKKIKSRLDDLITQLESDVDSDSLEPSNMLREWEELFAPGYRGQGVYLYLDPGNRTHFPIGLPKSFQGYNLGYKIYRRLLNTLTYMQSSANATREVQNIYRALLKESDVNCVIIENSVLLLKKELSINKKMNVIYDFIYNSYLSLRKKEPYTINKDVILDSDLSKAIGQRNIKDIFQNSFDEYRDYYKNIPKRTYGYRG